MNKVWVLFLSILIISCQSDDDENEVDCLPSGVFTIGLVVTFRDINTNEPITDDIVSAKARDGNYERRLVNYPQYDHFISTGIKSGTYKITVISNNYKYHNSYGIEVLEDECGIKTTSVDIFLEPN